MSSTTVNIGISGEAKVSSRVLKPPGGGHTDIFAPTADQVLKPRPKHNQQNSTMMGEIMGKANDVYERKENGAKEAPAPVADIPKATEPPKSAEPAARVRVPPGGFSSGLW